MTQSKLRQFAARQLATFSKT